MKSTDPMYHSTKAVADQLFSERARALSTNFKDIVDQTAARGFSELTGPAIGAMSEATVQCLQSTSDDLLHLYERAFAEAPSLGQETLNAIRSRLAAHVCGQMQTLSETLHGTLESNGAANAGSDPVVIQTLNHVMGQIRQRVDRIAVGHR